MPPPVSILPVFQVAGGPGGMATRLSARLAAGGAPLHCLVNADAAPDAACVVARCQDFAAARPRDQPSLIVTLLHAAPEGLAHLAAHAAQAALWAFTRQAALDWASRGIRVNAIGLGTSPAGPFEPTEQAGRSACAMPEAAATLDDIVRTLRAIAAWPSMTGQIVRLGV